MSDLHKRVMEALDRAETFQGSGVIDFEEVEFAVVMHWFDVTGYDKTYDLMSVMRMVQWWWNEKKKGGG